MRHDPESMLATLLAYFTAEIPPAISGRGLPAFDAIISTPPDNMDEKQFCVYLAEGQDSENSFSEVFICHVQLPAIMDVDFVGYHTALWKLVHGFDSAEVGAETKNTTHQTWYPSEMQGGAGSFAIYEMQFTGAQDDCDLD